MGKLVPFRPARRTSGWTKASAHLPKRRPSRSGRWFWVLLVTLPLAAFTAVLLLPLSGGPEEAAATVARLNQPDRFPRTAAELDAEQPQISGGFALPGSGPGSGPGSVSGAGGAAASSAGDRERAFFAICSGPVRVTCVVDGDTIWYEGTKIRIADLDTPEVSQPACANEAAMGRKATRRMQALLNAGPFTLEPNPEGRAEDRYGRSLMLVTRNGQSLGAVLVDEGLAEQWGGPKVAWC